MKKIVRVRKAIQGLAMTLALATTISGCSFDNKTELNNDNSIAYESIEEDVIENTTDEHKQETKENETVDNKDEHVHVHEDNKKLDSTDNTKKTFEKEETLTENEVKHDYTQESFIVMYEGQELIIPNLSMQYKNQEYAKNSIIKALKLAGFKSDYSYRKILAGFFEIENYKGTAEQNITLLNYLRHPELYLNMDLVIVPSEKIENTGVTIENNNGVVNPDTNGNGNNANDNHDDNHKGDDDHGKDDKKKHKHSLKTTVTYEQLENNQHRKVTTVTCRGYIDGKPCTFKKVTYGKAENCKFDKDSLECVCGRVHKHTYGDEVITYVDTEGSTHTIVVSKDCTYGDDHVEISRTKAPHKFENYVVNAGTNTETGTCECGKTDTREITIEHKHVIKTEVTYEQLENNQHRKVTTNTCTGLINGKPCTFKEVKYGEPENCKFDDDTLKCVCGRVHIHTEKIETTYEQLENNQHRKVTTTTCTGLLNGKPCTYKKVEYGEPENCVFDENTLKCICGRVHVHKWEWVKVDNDNCQQKCLFDGKTNGEPTPHISDGTGTPTIVSGSGTASGHDTQTETHCTKCDDDYTTTNSNVPHGNEQTEVVGDPTYDKTTLDDGTPAHIKHTTYKYMGCGYEYTVNSEPINCVDNGTGKCECGREMTHSCDQWRYEEVPADAIHCPMTKTICGICDKEDETRRIGGGIHKPERQDYDGRRNDKIVCSECFYVLASSVLKTEDWIWDYDPSIVCGATKTKSQKAASYPEESEEGFVDEESTVVEEPEIEEKLPIEGETPEEGQPQEGEGTPEEGQPQEGEQIPKEGQPQEGEETLEDGEPEESEQQVQKVEQGEGDEKSEEQHVSKDETDLYTAYNEAVTAYLRQYAKDKDYYERPYVKELKQRC